MAKIIYITGGARSGKSSLAEEFALRYEKVAYIATAVITDEEMQERVRKHRERRPTGWHTFEQHTGIGELIRKAEYDVYLLDCVTILLTNTIFDLSIKPEALTLAEQESIESRVSEEIKGILGAARESSRDLIVVSNEVGMGLVPEYPLARFFRDAAGRVNRILAVEADEAYFMVSGIPLKLKGV